MTQPGALDLPWRNRVQHTGERAVYRAACRARYTAHSCNSCPTDTTTTGQEDLDPLTPVDNFIGPKCRKSPPKRGHLLPELATPVLGFRQAETTPSQAGFTIEDTLVNHKIARYPGAPCAQHPADWLDPRRRTHTARRCLTCRALTRCATDAQRMRPDYGMWAGVWIDGDFARKQHLFALARSDPETTEPVELQHDRATPPTPTRAVRPRRVGALCTSPAPPTIAALITARASAHCEIMAPACTYTQTAIFSRRRTGTPSQLSSPAEAVAACANCIDLIEHTALPIALDLGYIVNARSCASTVALWWRQRHWIHLDTRGGLNPAGTARLSPIA